MEFGTHSDVLFLIGTNTSECHPIVAMHMLKGLKRGAKLIVVDPKKTDMAKKADIYLQIPVGYNIPLINAMINYIIENNLIDKEFIKDKTHGFRYVKEVVKDFTPQRVEQETGISAKLVEKAAQMYAKAKVAAICYTMGVTQFIDGTSNVFSLSNLALITGNIGKKGGGINPLRGQNNVQGACDMGALPNALPNGLVTDENKRLHVEKIWNTKLSKTNGIPLTKVPKSIKNGDIKLLFVCGENPVMSDPWTEHFTDSLQHLDTLIVQDIFLTQTAQRADVVLPAAAWGEKDGTFINTSRRVQFVAKAVTPNENLQSDWKVICNVASRLNLKGFDYKNSEEIWEEIRQVNPNFFGGISYERIKKLNGISWPCPNENHMGTPTLYEGGISMLEDKKFKLVPVVYAQDKKDRQTLEQQLIKKLDIPKDYPIGSGALSEKTDEIYPCMFTTGRKVYHYHTRSMTKECKTLEFGADSMGAVIEISEDIAASQNLEDGCYGVIENKRGKIAAKIRINPDLRYGTIFTTFHYEKIGANILSNATDLDPLSGMTPMKMTIANIKKISEQEYLKIQKQTDTYMNKETKGNSYEFI